MRRPKLAKVPTLALLLFLVALAIRFFHLSVTPFGGDELAIFQEAGRFTNLNGIAYFGGMHFWLDGGISLFWLRIPNAFLSALAVPILWRWLHDTRSAQVALLASLLFTLSPFAIEFSQEVRFYALLTCSSTLFFACYWSFLRKHKRWSLIALLLSGLLLICSHVLTAVPILLTVAHWLLFHYPPVAKRKRVLLIAFIGVSLVGLIFLSNQAFLAWGYRLIRVVQTTSSTDPYSYTGPRGITFITAAKLAWLAWALFFGQLTYPFNAALIVCALCIAMLFISGLTRLWRQSSKDLFWFALINFAGSIFIIYLVFDSLWPSSVRESTGPRYVLFTLPIFLWILAEGIAGLSRRLPRIGVIILLILTETVGIGNLFFPTWNSSYKAIDFETAYSRLNSLKPDAPIIYADGRAFGSAQYFLSKFSPSILKSLNVFPTELAQIPAKVVALLSLDDREQPRCVINTSLKQLSTYQERFAWVSYPFFVYVYDLDRSSNPRELPVPRAAYSLEFSDLRLPQQAVWKGQTYKIGGMYYLPDCNKSLSVQVENLQLQGTKELVLFSNLTQADKIPDGIVIAELKVRSDTDAEQIILIRKGENTQNWRGQCAGCQPSLQWHKYISLLGNSAYPDAYQDFQAIIWGASLPLNTRTNIKSVSIQLKNSAYKFNIWGVFASD